MSSANIPPRLVNGQLNSVFNSNDFVSQTEAKYDAKYDARYDARYLKLTGGTLSGGLTTNNITVESGSTISTPSLTATNGITSSGTNQFNSNITLPTTYSVSPNASLPSNTQLGGYLTAQNAGSGVSAATGVVVTICSLELNAGVWLVCWRGSIFPGSTGSSTYSNLRMAISTNGTGINHAIDVQQRVAISASQTCTFGATNGYDVSLMGSTIFRPTDTTTYYLNAVSIYTGVNSLWRGHIHAVRIA